MDNQLPVETGVSVAKTAAEIATEQLAIVVPTTENNVGSVIASETKGWNDAPAPRSAAEDAQVTEMPITPDISMPVATKSAAPALAEEPSVEAWSMPPETEASAAPNTEVPVGLDLSAAPAAESVPEMPTLTSTPAESSEPTMPAVELPVEDVVAQVNAGDLAPVIPLYPNPKPNAPEVPETPPANPALPPAA